MNAFELAEKLTCVCRRCNHTWLRRNVEVTPVMCPKCHSAYWRWEKGKVPDLQTADNLGPVLQCRRCDAQWTRRSLKRLPRVCPRCGSPYWRRKAWAQQPEPGAEGEKPKASPYPSFKKEKYEY